MVEEWVIPPKENANFVAHMEDILELYQQPYEADCPLICTDEQPVQLLKERRTGLPAQPGYTEKWDYQYERKGAVNIFILSDPLRGWRHTLIREHKASLDWAQVVKELVDRHYPQARKIRLVCDNYRTHSLGALYEAFHAEEARRLAQRLEIHYTPVHGSWLNMAEIELSAIAKRCFGRWNEDMESLEREVTLWERERNANQKGVDWRFTNADARIRLKRLYPRIQL